MSISVPQTDVLLYIALSEEFNDLSDELIEELGDQFIPQELDEVAITIFFGNVFSSILKSDFQLAVVPAGKIGITRAAAVTSAILAKSPTCDVVVLGIAGSLSNDLQPGDVFIPDSVNEYLANSATKGKGKRWTFETSGNNLPTSPRLLNRFQMFRHTQKVIYERWSKDCAARFAPLIDGDIQKAMTKAGVDIRPEIRLFAGDDRKLASGPAVGKGKAFVEWIKREVDRKAAALEMESAGVYDAAQIRTPAPRVIAIRGISDFADERKELIEDAAKDRFRGVSVKNALSLLLRGIEAGLFKKDGVQGSGSSGSYEASPSESRIKPIFVMEGITEEDPDSDAEVIKHHLGLDRTRAIIVKEIKTALKVAPRGAMFEKGGLCNGYVLQPMPDNYFVAQEFGNNSQDLRSALTDALEVFGVKPICADDYIWSGAILCKISALIQSTPFGVYQLTTSQDRNVYLELGIAIGLGRPFILVKDKNADVALLVQGLEYYPIDNYIELRYELGEKVRPFLTGIAKYYPPTLSPVVCENIAVITPGNKDDIDFCVTVARVVVEHNLLPVFLGEASSKLARYLDLEKMSYRIIDNTGKMRLNETVSAIQSARLGVYRIDKSAASDAFLSLGISMGLNRPGILMHKQSEDPPSDLRGLFASKFVDCKDLRESLTRSSRHLLGLRP